MYNAGALNIKTRLHLSLYTSLSKITSIRLSHNYLSPCFSIQQSAVWRCMLDRRDICVLTPWPCFGVSSSKPGVNGCTRSWNSVDCLQHHALLHAAWLKSKERHCQIFFSFSFFVANIFIFVSSIDNTHPATWQWVTSRSNVLAPPLSQSCVFWCVLHVQYVCVYACACLPACSVRASDSVTITVSSWAGNGRMKLW